MSRFADYEGDDEWTEGRQAMWEHNVRQAIRGKKGQKALRLLREALLALPERRLIEGALCTVGGEARLREDIEKSFPIERWKELGDDLERRQKMVDEELSFAVRELGHQGEGVCAVGAYIWFKKVKDGMSPEEAFAAVPTLSEQESDAWETVESGKEAGLTGALAWELAQMNDEIYGGRTPEERWQKIMDWLDRNIVGA